MDLGMEINSLADISNKTLIKSFLVEDNVEILEDKLDKYSREFERLEAKKDKLDFGKTLTIDEVKELALVVFDEVDKFFNVSGIKRPRVRYSSLLSLDIENVVKHLAGGASISLVVCGVLSKNIIPIVPGVYLTMKYIDHLRSEPKYPSYSPFFRSITLSKERESDLPNDIGHEYTHHLHSINGIDPTKYGIYSEGVARAVERHISKVFSEREDNEAYLYSAIDKTVSEVKASYWWLCEKLNEIPNVRLTSLRKNDLADDILTYTIGKPTYHAIGNAWGVIHEAKNNK